jgi:hypothetical protein
MDAYRAAERHLVDSCAMSHFLRQLSILNFILRERSPEPDESA